MVQSGTLVKQVAIKLDGDVFYEIYKCKQHHISQISPSCIKSVELHDGEWGVVGSVILWNFIHDGKEKIVREVIEEVDDEKRFLCFKVTGGDLMDAYNTFLVKIQVDTMGEENLVTWTFNYEKLKETVENPHTLMDLCLNVTKDIENSSHLVNLNKEAYDHL